MKNRKNNIPNIQKWEMFFQSADNLDLIASFAAMIDLGMRPVPIKPDPAGNIKIPIGKNWGQLDIDTRRQMIQLAIGQQRPVGLGVQPDGYLVIDLDCAGKDRSRIGDVWKRAGRLLFGDSAEWPETYVVKTAGGAHIWFIMPDSLREHMEQLGKYRIDLGDGDAMEIYTGSPTKQCQVACPPSAGKSIATRVPPIDPPQAMIDYLHWEISGRKIADSMKKDIPAEISTGTPHMDWFAGRIDQLAARIAHAATGTRHDTFRACVRVAAGYAAGMGLVDQVGMVHTVFMAAMEQCGTDETPGIIESTFNWAWAKGIDQPLIPEIKKPKKAKADHPGDDREKLNDMELAELVIHLYGDKIRYCEKWKSWVSYNESRGIWMISNVYHMEYFQRLAENHPAMGYVSRLSAAAKAAMSKEEIRATPDDFDIHHDLLVVRNGTLNLSGPEIQLIPHSPDHMATKYADVYYDPAAQCPKFLATLAQSQPNPDIRAFLQRWLGTALTGQTLSKAIVNYGSGANGKSTVFETVGLILGDYFAKLPRGFLAKSNKHQHPAELVPLCGSRLALASEAEITDSMDESKIKTLLGDGRITARGMGENFWSFSPTHNLVVAVNDIPTISGQDNGIWRRLVFIPWNQQIPEHSQKLNYEKTLYAEEAAGILNWLLKGLLYYRAVGLETPAAITKASSGMRESSDWVAEFFCDCLEKDDDSRTRRNEIYQSYRKWARRNGRKDLASNRAIPIFDKKIESMGLRMVANGNVKFYVGIKTKDD